MGLRCPAILGSSLNSADFRLSSARSWCFHASDRISGNMVLGIVLQSFHLTR